MTLAIPKEITESLKYLTPQEREELDKLLLAGTEKWIPLPAQEAALNTEADVTFYGGAAGGGKTDLLIGLAMTQHTRSIIFRREGTQLQGIEDRIEEIEGSRDGYNSQKKVWKIGDKRIELGSCQHEKDKNDYQGRPHDLKGFDEITHFTESQFRFLSGWLRTNKAGQRKRIVCTGNPPTDADGEWVIRYFAPWLDDTHQNPAEPGELRWFAMIDGEEVEVGKEPFEHDGEIIVPQSRTFIPSKVEDNDYLMSTGYKAQLQALPEPLRSQMLKGDFGAGQSDNPWQVIPTDWVKAAQDRWTPDGKSGTMTAVGMDIARGGMDETILAPRYGNWFAELKTFPGSDTPDGATSASLAVSVQRNAAPIQLDSIGVGGSVLDHLKGNEVAVTAMNGSERSDEQDRSGNLGFINKRAEWWWKMREALDPDYGEDIALPPDSRLRADLCAPRWKLSARGIQVESKEDIIKRLGRSPDRGDAVVYALPTTKKPKVNHHPSPSVSSWMSI